MQGVLLLAGCMVYLGLCPNRSLSHYMYWRLSFSSSNQPYIVSLSYWFSFNHCYSLLCVFLIFTSPKLSTWTLMIPPTVSITKNCSLWKRIFFSLTLIQSTFHLNLFQIPLVFAHVPSSVIPTLQFPSMSISPQPLAKHIRSQLDQLYHCYHAEKGPVATAHFWLDPSLGFHTSLPAPCWPLRFLSGPGTHPQYHTGPPYWPYGKGQIPLP